MKRLLILLLDSTAYSCEMSPEEKLISDHEQTIGNSKIDLNLRFVSLEKFKDVYYKDSISEVQEYIDFESKEKIESLKDTDWLKEDPDQLDSLINIYSNTYAGTYLETAYLKLQALNQKSDQKAGEIWKAVYKIDNPLMGGVEQELTNTYVFDPDQKSIIRKLED
jgi:hypothetical protein